MTTRKRHKRTRKRHYITGTHISPKCIKPIKYRSSWELTTCIYLDNEPVVESYEYEAVKIKYISNKQTKKERNYIPDFLIVYLDKTKKLVEVKRKSQLNSRMVLKKAEAAREWCTKKKNIKYEIWSEPQIRAFIKIQKALAQEQNKD